MEIILGLVITAVLTVIGFVVGSQREKEHFRSIEQREEALKNIVVLAARTPPDIRRQPCRTEFVCGNVVVAMDYFKEVAGTIVSIFGGQVKHYETLVERARREAILRLKAQAQAQQAQLVINVTFATAMIKTSQKNQSGGVEVIAYGTAIVYQ